MRKRDPAAVRSEFDSEIVNLEAYYDRVVDAVEAQPHLVGDITRLAETTFLTAAVTFERFCSDLYISYLNKDFSQFQEFRFNAIRQNATEKYGVWIANRLTQQVTRHVSIATIEGIVDREGRNAVSASSHGLQTRAQEWLTGPYRKRVTSLTPEDQVLIDAVKSIRDFVAHRSRSAKKQMNTDLRRLGAGANKGLARGNKEVHTVGVYLRATVNSQARMFTYLDRIRSIASRM